MLETTKFLDSYFDLGDSGQCHQMSYYVASNVSADICNPLPTSIDTLLGSKCCYVFSSWCNRLTVISGCNISCLCYMLLTHCDLIIELCVTINLYSPNPFKPNGISYCYQLDQSISVLRVIVMVFFVLIQI